MEDHQQWVEVVSFD